MHTDARTLENETVITGDLCIVGAGAAGISMAPAWAGKSERVILPTTVSRKNAVRCPRQLISFDPIMKAKQVLRSVPDDQAASLSATTKEEGATASSLKNMASIIRRLGK